jgi:hypothetical protein
MSRRLQLISLVIACGTLCRGGEIELTGLVDMGSCRLACVKFEANGLTVRPGERAGDFLFEEMDSRAGWAQFRRGTNQVRIWLHSYCASPVGTIPVQDTRTLKREQALIRSGQMVAQDFSSGGPSEGSGSNIPEPADPYSLNESPYLLRAGADQRSPISRPTDNLGVSSSAQTAVPNSTSAPMPATVEVSGPVAGHGGSTVAALPTANQGSTPEGEGQSTVAASEPAVSEADQIRGLYGTAAFLAWDIARYRQAHPNL